MHGGRRVPSTTGSRRVVLPSTPGGRRVMLPMIGGNHGTNGYQVQSGSQTRDGLTSTRKRGETVKQAKLKEEHKVLRMRGSVQTRSTKERKLWKSKLKTPKTKNLQSLQKRSLVVAKNNFDLASVTEHRKRRDWRRRNSATERPRIWRRRFTPWRRCFQMSRSSLKPVEFWQQRWKSQRPQPRTRGACRALQ